MRWQPLRAVTALAALAGSFFALDYLEKRSCEPSTRLEPSHRFTHLVSDQIPPSLPALGESDPKPDGPPIPRQRKSTSDPS